MTIYPKFDLTPIEEADESDPQAIFDATKKVLFAFIYQCIYWSIEQHVLGQRKGKIPNNQGCDKQMLELTVFRISKLQNAELHEILLSEKYGSSIGNQLLGTAVNALIDNEQITYKPEDGTLIPAWNIPEEDASDDPSKKFELDGVLYPMVTRIAPKIMMNFGLDLVGFKKAFPDGDFSTIQTVARHLRANQITFLEHKDNGVMMYVYVVT